MNMYEWKNAHQNTVTVFEKPMFRWHMLIPISLCLHDQYVLFRHTVKKEKMEYFIFIFLKSTHTRFIAAKAAP